MGQQEIVAASALLRRVVLLLLVAAVIAAMAVATAGPAFASPVTHECMERVLSEPGTTHKDAAFVCARPIRL